MIQDLLLVRCISSLSWISIIKIHNVSKTYPSPNIYNMIIIPSVIRLHCFQWSGLWGDVPCEYSDWRWLRRLHLWLPGLILLLRGDVEADRTNLLAGDTFQSCSRARHPTQGESTRPKKVTTPPAHTIFIHIFSTTCLSLVCLPASTSLLTSMCLFVRRWSLDRAPGST